MTAGFELIIETRRRSDVLEEVVTTKCCLPFSIYLTYAMVERLALFICRNIHRKKGWRQGSDAVAELTLAKRAELKHQSLLMRMAKDARRAQHRR